MQNNFSHGQHPCRGNFGRSLVCRGNFGRSLVRTSERIKQAIALINKIAQFLPLIQIPHKDHKTTRLTLEQFSLNMFLPPNIYLHIEIYSSSLDFVSIIKYSNVTCISPYCFHNCLYSSDEYSFTL